MGFVVTYWCFSSALIMEARCLSRPYPIQFFCQASINFLTFSNITSDVTTYFKITIVYYWCCYRTVGLSSKVPTSADTLCVKFWTAPWCVSVSPKGACALGNTCSRCPSPDHIRVAWCFGQLHHGCSVSLVASRSPSCWQGHPEVRSSLMYLYDNTF